MPRSSDKSKQSPAAKPSPKSEPAPTSPSSPKSSSDPLVAKYGPVVFETGTWHVVSMDHDKGSNCKKCKIKATFQNDPDGFRGYGNSEKEAEAMLRKYASA